MQSSGSSPARAHEALWRASAKVVSLLGLPSAYATVSAAARQDLSLQTLRPRTDRVRSAAAHAEKRAPLPFRSRLAVNELPTPALHFVEIYSVISLIHQEAAA